MVASRLDNILSGKKQENLVRTITLIVTVCVAMVAMGCTTFTTQPVTDVSFRVPITKKLTAGEEQYCRERAIVAGNKARNEKIERELLGGAVGAGGGYLAGRGLGGNNYGYYGYGPYGRWYNPYGFTRGSGSLEAAGAALGGAVGAEVAGATGPGDPNEITQRTYLECTDRAGR